jgi:hypothetical protein
MLEKFQKKIWQRHLLLTTVSVVGIAYAAYLGFSVHQTNKQNLIMRAKTVAQSISAKDIAVLSGSEDDLNNPTYTQIKERLMQLRAINSDTRFIYLNGIKEGEIFFYVDSEDSQSPDYSPPGQIYDDATPLMHSLFETKESGFEVSRDQWGVWASALVPIVDPDTGNVIATLGIDVTAQKYVTDIAIYSLSALLFAILIMVVLLSQQRNVDSMKKTHADIENKNLELARLNEDMQKTQTALKEKNIELMQINELMVGRELRMVELKEKLKQSKDNIND